MTYITTKELAQRWGVHPATVWRWRKDSFYFPTPCKLGQNTTRWRLSDIERWEAAKRL